MEVSEIEQAPSYDIMLVVPPTYPEGRLPDYNPKPPLGLEYLSAYLQKDLLVSKICDFDVIGASANQVVQDILEKDPPLLGVTVLQRALPSVRYIHKELRRNGYDKYIIYGGIGATLCAREILEEFEDPNCMIVMGEGEEPLKRIVNAISNQDQSLLRDTPSTMYYDSVARKIFKNPELPLLKLDEIPWPDRQNLDLYTQKAGYLTLVTSRGCPWSHCTFCSNAAFEQRHCEDTWRSRTPEDVVDEMVDLYRRTGIEKFKTNDPNLFGKGEDGRQYVVTLCHEILSAKEKGDLPEGLSLMSFIRGEDVAGRNGLLELMKSAGFDRLLIGVESSVDEILLRKFKKGENIKILTQAIHDLKAVGISPVIGFLIFNPYTTLSTLKQDLKFLKENALVVNLSKSLRIFNGIPMQFMLEDEERLERYSPFETYHEYTVPREVSAIYYCMKALHVLIEDPIRKATQDRIWQIKKDGISFDKRAGYEGLQDIFWRIEVELLEACIAYYSEEEDNLYESVLEIYNIIKNDLLEQLSMTNANLLVTAETFYSNILEILTKKQTDNLHEEYVWNEI